MIDTITKYFNTMKNLFKKIDATDEAGKPCRLEDAVKGAVRMIINQASSGRKLLFIGNGASASIASHMATDFWKNGGVKALAFNDSSLLTCVSNDFGYKHVFEKPIEMFAEPGDILVAISSSGKSENILLAVSAAKKKGLKVFTFSGFAEDNPLRALGDLNFYIPVSRYGFVEVAHSAICHCLVDMITEAKHG